MTLPDPRLSYPQKLDLEAFFRASYKNKTLIFEAVPAACLELIESRTPRGSFWDTLLLLCHRGALGLGSVRNADDTLAEGVSFALWPSQKLGSGASVSVIFPEGLFACLNSEDLAQHLVLAFALYFLPAPMGEDRLSFARKKAASILDPMGIRARESQQEWALTLAQKGRFALLQALSEWTSETDPEGIALGLLHRGLQPHLKMLDVKELNALGLLSPYYRASLEIGEKGQSTADPISNISANLRRSGCSGRDKALFEVELPNRGTVLLPDAQLSLIDHGFESIAGQEKLGTAAFVSWLTAKAVKLRGSQSKVIALGITASGGTGKTTLALALKSAFEKMGLKVAYIGADAYLWPGQGFRYLKVGGHRETWLKGPGIYQDAALFADLIHLKMGGQLTTPGDEKAGLAPKVVGPVDVIITEGVFLGQDKKVAGALDLKIGLLVGRDSESLRFQQKYQRDASPNSVHHIDVALDFAEKIFQETLDGVYPIIQRTADVVYFREEGDVYVRNLNAIEPSVLAQKKA